MKLSKLNLENVPLFPFHKKIFETLPMPFFIFFFKITSPPLLINFGTVPKKYCSKTLSFKKMDNVPKFILMASLIKT